MKRKTWLMSSLNLSQEVTSLGTAAMHAITSRGITLFSQYHAELPFATEVLIFGTMARSTKKKCPSSYVTQTCACVLQHRLPLSQTHCPTCPWKTKTTHTHNLNMCNKQTCKFSIFSLCCLCSRVHWLFYVFIGVKGVFLSCSSVKLIRTEH